VAERLREQIWKVTSAPLAVLAQRLTIQKDTKMLLSTPAVETAL